MKRTTVNEFGETVVTMDRSDRGPLTKEEQQMIIHLDSFQDEYDEDCPPMPEEMFLQMQNDIEAKRRRRCLPHEPQHPKAAPGGL